MTDLDGSTMTEINLVHCSYHKCLTVYYGRVMQSVFNRCLPWSAGYLHYNSHLDDFYEGFRSRRVASVNNRALDLNRLGRFRISRFIRDPRDLVVSGYFYHRRGAEPWVDIEAPTAADWYFANGLVPEAVRAALGEAHDMRAQRARRARRTVENEFSLATQIEILRRL